MTSTLTHLGVQLQDFPLVAEVEFFLAKGQKT